MEANTDPQHCTLLPTYIQQRFHTDTDHGIDADRTSYKNTYIQTDRYGAVRGLER